MALNCSVATSVSGSKLSSTAHAATAPGAPMQSRIRMRPSTGRRVGVGVAVGVLVGVAGVTKVPPVTVIRSGAVRQLLFVFDSKIAEPAFAHAVRLYAPSATDEGIASMVDPMELPPAGARSGTVRWPSGMLMLSC